MCILFKINPHINIIVNYISCVLAGANGELDCGKKEMIVKKRMRRRIFYRNRSVDKKEFLHSGSR